jgi:cytochrome c oxidase assembly factor CtaG
VTPEPYSWTFEPLFLALAVVAAVLYWRAARRERPPWWRVASFGIGLALVAGALNSPLETIAAH